MIGDKRVTYVDHRGSWKEVLFESTELLQLEQVLKKRRLHLILVMEEECIVYYYN